MKFVSLFFVMFFCVFCDASYEEPKYTVIQTEENIEIRIYPSIIIAEVRMTGDKDQAMDDSFRILFKYITGNNETEQEIKMTIPVFQEKTDSEEWSMSFIMPSKWALSDIPQPKNDKITIKKLAEQQMIAIRFSGRSTSKRFLNHKLILEEYLSKKNIPYNKSKPIYAYYNSPWTLWFLKRNEVLFQIM